MRAEDVPDLPLIIDTDVASFIHTKRSPADRFKPLLRGHILCMSFATVAELWVGADNPKATWGKLRRDELDRFIRQHVVVPADYAVARRWASIYALLRDQVGVNDAWIAARALAQSPPLPVVTANLN